MRSIALSALVVMSLSCGAGRAQEARQVLERGMKARCDKIEMLEKQRRESIEMTGKIFLGKDIEAEATGEILADWPTSFRWSRELVDPVTKAKLRSTLCVHKQNGWTQQGQLPAVDVGLIELEDFKTEVYGRWLATLYPLKDESFTLTMLKDNRIGDEDVSVVKVALRLRPDVYLSFAQKSGQLLKVSYKAREGGAEGRKEHLLSDYREFDGIKLPTKMVDMWQVTGLPNEKKAEWTIKNYVLDAKLDAASFAKPEKK